jgi:hypothetical protein
MLNTQQVHEINTSLNWMITTAKEIEDVPNFGPDLWTMRAMDKKCQDMRQHCQRIAALVGSGDVLSNTDVPDGAKVVSPRAAAAVQQELNTIATLAKEIEDVPNLGPDLWSMRGIDKKCLDIRPRCQRVWLLLNPPSTNDIH